MDPPFELHDLYTKINSGKYYRSVLFLEVTNWGFQTSKNDGIKPYFTLMGLLQYPLQMHF